MENRVPEPVPYLLGAVAIAALGLIGHGCGLGGWRRFVPTALVSILVALVLALIIDLDRPRRGPIKVSQASMVTLKETLKPAKS